ncbi:MAG TPA: antibiotic biosynthesis monooxygenase [Terriglobales bacterium]|nr:antibiotic biosynthesis monooxygenase [Terriglobales bacterium]
MLSRIIDCKIQPGHVREFREIVSSELLPQIKQQPGFVDAIESVDAADGHYVCMTLWQTRADVERYDGGLFKEVATKLMPMMNGEASVSTLEVDNSTVHNISAGRAAAA